VQHLEVKAAVELTDRGEFEALAATYAVDRVKDQIVRGAFAKTIAAWRASGKSLPLLWNHSGAAEDLIGTVDPFSMRETDEGFYVAGSLDLEESEVARNAWRAMKKNAVALSFGYLAPDMHRRKDGIQELREIDLYEITVCPGPCNPRTRFLSLKAAAAERTIPTDAELRAEAVRLGLELPLSNAELRRKCDRIQLEAALGFDPPPKREPEPQRKSLPTTAELRREFDRLRVELAMDGIDRARADTGPPVPTDAELRRKCAELGHPVPPSRRTAPFDQDAARVKARDDILALFAAADEANAA